MRIVVSGAFGVRLRWAAEHSLDAVCDFLAEEMAIRKWAAGVAAAQDEERKKASKQRRLERRRAYNKARYAEKKLAALDAAEGLGV